MKAIKKTIATNWLIAAVLFFTGITLIASSDPCCDGQKYDPSVYKCCQGTAKIPIAEECCGATGYDPGSYGCCKKGGNDTVASKGSKCCDLAGTRTIYSDDRVCCAGESGLHEAAQEGEPVAPADSLGNSIVGNYAVSNTDSILITISPLPSWRNIVTTGDMVDVKGDITYTPDGPAGAGAACGEDHQEPSRNLPGTTAVSLSGSVSAPRGASIGVSVAYVPGNQASFPLELADDEDNDVVWVRLYKQYTEPKEGKFTGSVRDYTTVGASTISDKTEQYNSEELLSALGSKVQTNWKAKFDHEWCCKEVNKVAFDAQ